MVGAQKRLKEVFAKSIPSVVRFMEIAPLVVVTSPIIYAGTGLRVKRGSPYHSLAIRIIGDLYVEKFKEGKRVAFDEFKLFYDSAEKVTDRRNAANRWNYSICIAIIGAIAAIISWSLGKPAFLLTGIACVVLLAGMAALYCTLWIGQIRDLKELNNAKFTVINEMASFVSFGDGNNENLISYKPFEKEWDALTKAKIAEEVKSINIIALKSSNIEYLIPKAFRVLFVLIIVAVPLESWRNYNAISKVDPKPTTAAKTEQKAVTN